VAKLITLADPGPLKNKSPVGRIKVVIEEINRSPAHVAITIKALWLSQCCPIHPSASMSMQVLQARRRSAFENHPLQHRTHIDWVIQLGLAGVGFCFAQQSWCGVKTRLHWAIGRSIAPALPPNR